MPPIQQREVIDTQDGDRLVGPGTARIKRSNHTVYLLGEHLTEQILLIFV